MDVRFYSGRIECERCKQDDNVRARCLCTVKTSYDELTSLTVDATGIHSHGIFFAESFFALSRDKGARAASA